jgi:tRNA(Ile)-lysidine synthase
MPLGSRHRKKLSDLFTECHVPLQRKRHIPIIESGSSILWVCGLRLDDRFKLTARTQRALRITYQPMTGPSTP